MMKTRELQVIDANDVQVTDQQIKPFGLYRPNSFGENTAFFTRSLRK